MAVLDNLNDERIDRLNNNFENIIPVTSKFGNTVGGYMRIGKIVHVDIKLYFNISATPNQSDIIEGLPLATTSYKGLNGFNINSGVVIPVFIFANALRSTAQAGHLASNQSIHITGSYFAQ